MVRDTGAPAAFSALVWLLFLIAFGFLLVIGKFILMPLAIALLLSSAIQPLIDRLEKLRVPWWGTVTLVMLALVALLFWAGGAVYANASDFMKSLDTAHPTATAPQDFEKTIQDVWSDPKRLTDLAKEAAPKLTAYIVGAFGVMFGVLNQVGLVLLFTVFVFVEKQASRRKVARVAGTHAPQVQRVIQQIARDVNRYLSTKTVLGFLTGVACMISLAIIGVPYAPLFGLIAFLLNYIPTIGGLAATVPPVVAAFVTYNRWTEPLLVFGAFTVINVIVGNVLEPRWLGKQLGLSALVMLIALMFWSAMWGFAGMVLAIPLTRIVQLVFANVPELKSIAVLMSDGAEDGK